MALPGFEIDNLEVVEHRLYNIKIGHKDTSNNPSRPTAMNVVSAIARIGSLKACFIAAKAMQYFSFDLNATRGAW